VETAIWISTTCNIESKNEPVSGSTCVDKHGDSAVMSGKSEERSISMSKRSIRFFLKNIILILCMLQTVSSCSHLPQTQTLSPTELRQVYSWAIKDAEVAESHEIYRSLVAIIPSNNALSWQKDTGSVLVVTWTSWDGYDDRVGSSEELQREVWVTVVPEVKTFCCKHRITPKQVSLRLEQLLGLPPENGKTKFVEMWVLPKDLFRPSPDPEVSDHEAELDFPESDRFVTVSKEYRQWFHNMKQKSYGADGYPWTRLGYTYDWGNPDHEIGLSEFVIRAGAKVTIHAISNTMDYCCQ